MTDCTVILPVFNQASTVASTCDAVVAFAAEHPQYDFIVVDDGSKDDTAAIVRGELERAHTASVRIMSLAANSGKGAAVKAGILASRSPLVCFTDGDLAYSLEHLHSLREALATHDVVIGSRSLVARDGTRIPPARRMAGRVFNRLVRTVMGLPFDDTQCGLKGFRARAAQLIFPRLTVTRFAFDVEVLCIARRVGLSVGEIPAHIGRDHAQTGSTVSLFRDSLRMAWSLAKIRLLDARGRYGTEG